MDINALVSNILGTVSSDAAGFINPISTALPVTDLSAIQVPNMNDYVKKAFEELKPYYSKLLTEAQGDTNLAIKNLQTDYEMGTRFIAENTKTATGQIVDNLDAALKSLGLTFQKEGEAATDSLNKRGMAVTESNPGQDLNVLKDGEGAREMGQLTTDQQLRKEAEQRTATQNLTNLGIKAKQDTQSAQQKLTESTQNTLMDYRSKAEGYQQQMEGQASQIGGLNQEQQNTAATLQLNKDQLAAQSGGGSGSSSRGDKPGSPPVPGNTGAGVNTTSNGWRWTGSEWV